MASKIISFMHVSLNGFVAGLNGEMNWIMVNQGPIYLIDYMNGRIVWFIERQVGEPSSGSEI